MLTSVLPAPKKYAAEKTGNTFSAPSLWERMMAACSRSFELLAESKSRFPMDT
jgi:hypothetical protein